MSARILCIEDDEDTRELLVDFLGGRGYRVEAATDGREGLERILADPPDLVLCDISMPRMSGLEVLETLSGLDADRLGSIPFLFLTVLTRREIEMLTWAARGKSSTDIAAFVGLSDRTVDFHIENAIKKLGVATRVQAVLKAKTLGLIRD